jgi:signal transduction histidine kinase
MSDNNYQEVIKNNKLFDGIPPQNLKFLFRNEQIIRKREGEIIFQKGDESKNTYLVIAGRVKIKVYIENKSVKLNKTINDFFGEIEVLEDTYRRSAAVANSDCILYSLTKADLRSILADNPEINDNIIAYNKVEIPELQIIIHPGLLKDDTDKLYVAPLQENMNELTNETLKSGLSEFPRHENESALRSDIISEIDDEDHSYPEDIKAVDEVSTDEETYSALPDNNPENEPPEIETRDEIIEEERSSGNTPLSEEYPEDVDGTKESEEIVNQEDDVIPVNTTDTPGDNHTGESESSQSGSPEENIISVNYPGIESLNPEIRANDNSTNWLNLNPASADDEVPDDSYEEEKLRLEMADEKLKYDDTEIDTVRILDAIKKINSSLDKRGVYSGIVREAVKLTEAQAGVLYRVDPVKNLLITEQEIDDGFVEVSYSFADGLTGLAAETGEIINVRDPEKDFRYSEEIDSISGIVGTSLMCVPVKNDNADTIAVICLANSSSGKFSISDEEKISQLVPHISQRLQCLASINKLLDDSKNIYLSTLTKFITDNIQTPVLTMKYYAGQIKKKSVPQDVRTVLNVLMDQADSVVDFLHSTLAFTENRNTLEIEKCSLKTVLDDTLGLLAEYVESRNVGLYKKVESNINVKLDKKAFYQACHQIAKNACDAMGESGNIYITAKQSGDLVNIEFRDTGPGIPDDIKAQIFQPFKSFKKENATGLGLTIAQRIIRDHGGELTVESNPEQGATFIISLPVFDEV